jgi:hypothetical protein
MMQKTPIYSFNLRLFRTSLPLLALSQQGLMTKDVDGKGTTSAEPAAERNSL